MVNTDSARPHLSPEQELFCLEFARHGNAVDAFKNSHLSKVSAQKFPEIKAKASAAELMANEDIRSRILDIQNRLADKSIMSKDEVLVELSRIARTAPFHADRNRALDLLGKYHKMFVDIPATANSTFIKEQKVIQIVYMASDGSGRVTSTSPLRNPPQVEIAQVEAAPATAPAIPVKSRAVPVMPVAAESEDILGDLDN
jgi:hypothetical protein